MTVRQFLLKKFPTNKYIDCPVPKHHWETMQEYAEAYYNSFKPMTKTQAAELFDKMADNYNLSGDTVRERFMSRDTFIEVMGGVPPPEVNPFKFYENTFAISLENLKGSPDAEIKKDFMVEGNMDILANALIRMMEQHPTIEKLLCITVQNFLTREQEPNEN